MSIRIPYQYTYTEYKNSRLATAVDRLCHSLIRIPIGMVLMILPLILYGDFMYKVIQSEAVHRILSYAYAIFCVIWILILCFLGLICDKTGLSARIAVWDLNRRKNGGKLSLKFKVVLGVLVLVLLFPRIYMMVDKNIQKARANKYHETMQVLDTMDWQPTGTKIAAYDTESERYTINYIPEEALAETPDEVGYLLNYQEGTELVGFYSMGVGGYQRYCLVTLVDLSDDSILASELFWGDTPPYSTSSDEDQYGSYPDEAQIIEWVKENIQ